MEFVLLKVPEDLRLLKEQVRILSIDISQLRTVPEWLGEFQNLESLDFCVDTLPLEDFCADTF